MTAGSSGWFYWVFGSLMALAVALSVGDLFSTIAKVSSRDPSNWRDDFGGEMDLSLWHVGPPYLPLPGELEPNGYWTFADPGDNEIRGELANATVEGGLFHVSGKGVRLRHVLYPPLRIRARVSKPDYDPNGLEHVVELRPLHGGLSLAPGWRCDPDLYQQLPPKEVSARLARWPGGRSCYWNCSEMPVERTLEIMMDEEGIISIADDAGCRSDAVSRVGSPVHVIVGCRTRAPRTAYSSRPGRDVQPTEPRALLWPDEDVGESHERSAQEAFPYPGSDEVLSAPCPRARAAHFDWFEVRAKRSMLDPRLEPQASKKWEWLQEKWHSRIVPRMPNWVRGFFWMGAWAVR